MNEIPNGLVSLVNRSFINATSKLIYLGLSEKKQLLFLFKNYLLLLNMIPNRQMSTLELYDLNQAEIYLVKVG